ncbi:competence protein ComGC [Evansella caseinilytica]|uniref:ComG operon protein 3 n=1 Tax=Evansella caseinilytica TaxID=1503961 RepID=A0A1H3KSK8_9BACI|nr:competence type IV pilus major pilin ComGC [Evansella caseinilytica]SDY55167.1 competence protein ComGC [Evansella caseinilytica]
MKKIFYLLRKEVKNKRGFTLLEMMIVIVIISILLLIAVPNLAKNKDMANEKGCEATIELLRAQKTAYEIETGNTLTDLETLLAQKYVDRITCPDGRTPDMKDLDF